MFPAATKQRAVLEAKRKSTEENTASLIQDEEDAWSSEPDPVSTSGLAAALSSTASRDNLKEVLLLAACHCQRYNTSNIMPKVRVNDTLLCIVPSQPARRTAVLWPWQSSPASVCFASTLQHSITLQQSSYCIVSSPGFPLSDGLCLLTCKAQLRKLHWLCFNV